MQRSAAGWEEPADEEPEAADDSEEIDAATAVRIPMAPGVELLVAKGVELPAPRYLVEIALLIRKLFALK